MVERTKAVIREPGLKVRMTDQKALFELTVANAWPDDGPDIDDAQYEKALNEANSAEGRVLEQLAEQWMREFRDIIWTGRGLEAGAAGNIAGRGRGRVLPAGP